ncbi:uncharacterized protein B0T23DRAFT_369527 [Neurospora hispaniola]|uniref:Uncharacterized protein n=1 Tax=Neurospora hispaniola TaxID=588809 RepID=A0AAJ0IFI9_9PEZI|nr:hypothetical protein B0T23DRAFT_369527 [Neurospora hispaniola]
MFEVPDAKRVRRDELFGSGTSDRGSSPDTADEAEVEAKAQLLNAKLSSLLSLKVEFDDGAARDDDATTAAREPTEAAAKQPEVAREKPQKKEKETKQTSQGDAESSDDDGSDEEDTPMQDQAPLEEEEEAAEFEFRLFSTSAPQKIVLPSKDEEDGAGETVIADRPISYYIRGELTPEEQEQFRAAAVTSQDILNWAKQRAWGLEVPWRVRKIVVTVKGKKADRAAAATALHGQPVATGTEVQQQSEQQKKKKKRLGKKGRIAMRIKEKARKEKEEAEQKQKMTKEEHLKEKKKRLNREKKLKRRQKEKEKKMAGKAGSSVGDAMSAVGQDSDSEGDEKENKIVE